MIWILQAIIVFVFCKDYLHKGWIKVVLCLKYFYHEKLKIALMNSQGFIWITIINFRIIFRIILRNIPTIISCNSQSSLNELK